MLLLAIDTAGPACSVAIVRDGDALASLSDPIGRGHAERLMPMIEEVLSKAAVAFKDLERIAVTAGPGSFTGVRIGVAAARGLALSLGIPAIGVGSLDALALPVASSAKAGTVVAALDARRDELYALAKDLATGETAIEATTGSVKALAAKLVGARPPLVLIGAGAPLLAAALAPRDVTIAGSPEYPDILDVARLGSTSTALAPPVPHYVRGADAKPQSDKALAHR
jgi:tRNA threonylcarbamoyladenosine biosynthesis protein TsaB